jgi:hypothetical protein
MNPQNSFPPPPPPGIEAVIIPRAHDVGGFEVRRVLPAQERQMIGPFIFFDQMGPGEFLIGQGLDVRPHPHLGGGGDQNGALPSARACLVARQLGPSGS